MSKLIGIALLATLLGGCHKKHHKTYDPIRNITEAGKEKDLQGRTFESECWVKPLDAVVSGLMTEGKASVKAEKVSYRFDGANMTRQTGLFVTSDCKGEPVFRFDESATIKIDKGHKSNDGGYHIDIMYSGLKGVPLSADGVTVANAMQLCGVANWVKDEERDVQPQSADLTCYAVKVPRRIYTVYRVDDKDLYFGTPAASGERPGTLDHTRKYSGK